MIEDALKTTRALHRLIMTVSLAIIVFSLSLSNLSDERKWESNIDGLIQLDFLSYDNFVQELVKGESALLLEPLAEQIKSGIDDIGQNLILEMRLLSEIFSAPFHIGKIKLADFGMNNTSTTNLNELILVNTFDASKDVQIVIPEVGDLPKLIIEFLDKHRGTDGYVGGLILNVGGELKNSNLYNSFLADELKPGLLTFSFQLSGAIPNEPPKSFETSLKVKVHTVKNSSFMHWVKQNISSNGILDVQGEKIVFGKDLIDLPVRYRDVPLGKLSKIFADRILAAGPEGRSVSILGTDVPGTMITIASPLVLLFLMFYFVHHIRHLSKLVETEPKAALQFAWLPISLGEGWPVSWSWMRRNVPVWGLQAVFDSIALPVASLVLLYIRIWYFSGFKILPVSIIVVGVVGVVSFGFLVLKNIGMVRQLLRHKSG